MIECCGHSHDDDHRVFDSLSLDLLTWEESLLGLEMFCVAPNKCWRTGKVENPSV